MNVCVRRSAQAGVQRVAQAVIEPIDGDVIGASVAPGWITRHPDAAESCSLPSLNQRAEEGEIGATPTASRSSALGRSA